MSENAQLIGLSRQMALQRQMDVVANNMANINTTGFKGEQILFEQYVMPVARDQRLPRARTSRCPMSRTGRPCTIMSRRRHRRRPATSSTWRCNGDGFFAVQTPGGERWTRAGAFAARQCRHAGRSQRQSGSGRRRPDHLRPRGNRHHHRAQTAPSAPATAPRASCASSNSPMPQDLNRDGYNLFSGGTPVPATQTRVMQGFDRTLERLGRHRNGRNDPRDPRL